MNIVYYNRWHPTISILAHLGIERDVTKEVHPEALALSHDLSRWLGRSVLIGTEGSIRLT
jgi:hypothetical protein